MKSHRLTFCLWPAVLLLTACSSLETPRPYWQKDSPASSPLASAIDYHAYAWGLNGNEWTREYNRLNNTPRSSDETLCLRQSLLTTAPGAPERIRPMPVIEQCERELRKTDPALLGLLGLIKREYLERQRSEERQRDAAKRADELAQKLNELKTIEKTLLERKTTVSRPRQP